MLIPAEDEPTTREAVDEWVRFQNGAHNLFADVYSFSEAHRAEHGCDLYPTGSGPLLGVLARAARPRRVLEIGCGLGYSALWMAHGAGADGSIDTIERDATHAALARAETARHGGAERISVLEGDALAIVPRLDEPYGLIFCDSDVDRYPDLFPEFTRLLAMGGLLISSNLFLGVHVPDAPWLAAGARYRAMLLEDRRLMTAFLPRGLALSVRVP